MSLTFDAVISAAAALTAATTIAGGIAAVVKWFERQARQDREIQEIRSEQCVVNYALLACLDGLKQLGANGNVTDAHNRLEKHLNKQAHNME